MHALRGLLFFWGSRGSIFNFTRPCAPPPRRITMCGHGSAIEIVVTPLMECGPEVDQATLQGELVACLRTSPGPAEFRLLSHLHATAPPSANRGGHGNTSEVKMLTVIRELGCECYTEKDRIVGTS